MASLFWHFLIATAILSCKLTMSDAVCDDPPHFLNAAVNQEDLLQPIHNGTIINYSCLDGFHKADNISSTAMCIIGNEASHWKYEPFTCEPACFEFPDVPNAELLREDLLLPLSTGTIVKYTCNSGYTTDNTFPRILCDNGSWIVPKEPCQPRRCGDPGHIENAQRKGHVFNFPHNVTYICKEGFRLKGTANIYCMPSGSWKPRPPSCEAIVCPLLPPLKNGKLISSDRTYNAVATYECNRKFHLVGSAIRICQDDALWNGSMPTCVVTTCLNPGQLENGRVIPMKELYNAGDLVIFQCFHSRLDERQLTSKCLEDGTWQRRPPHCAAVPTSVAYSEVTTTTLAGNTKTTENPFNLKSNSCDDPGDIRNGNRIITGYTPNSNVTYICEEGYELRGEGTLICLLSGKWNLDKLPICVMPIPVSTILGIVIGLVLLVTLGISGFFLYHWRERKLRGYGKKSKALTADATDLEEIAGLEKGKKTIPVTVL